MKSSMMSNYIQRDGFVMVSNLLITYQAELDITDRELIFIIKATKHKENYKLHDDQLDPTVSSRTLQRCRKSLTEKGFLKYKVWKYTDDKGHIHTEGITYDFSPLEERLQQISNSIAAEKESQINKEAENYIIEFGEESPMAKFLKAWEEHYGDLYRISPLERNWYNGLSEEEQEYIGRIFEYCEDNRLFKTITPRLALFMKTPTRWEHLKSFCEENPEENIVNECLEDTEENIINECLEDTVEEIEEIIKPKKQIIKPKEIIEKEIKEAEEKIANTTDDIELMVWNQFLKDKLEELNKIGEEN